MCSCAPTIPPWRSKLHMKGASPADVFGELRERKNKS